MEKVTFSSLKTQVNKATAESKKKFRANLTDQINKGVNLAQNWYYKKELFTPAKLRDYTAGKMTKKEVVSYLMERYTARSLNKQKENALNKIAAAAETGGAVEIIVSLRWTSAYTGSICHAEVEAITADRRHYNATGRAGGYGYDKASAAAADAFAKLPPVLFLVYKMANAKKDIPYGASYRSAGLPFFDGGCGMSCFEQVFKAAGLKKTRYHGTKTTDLYIYSK